MLSIVYMLCYIKIVYIFIYHGLTMLDKHMVKRFSYIPVF